MEALRKAFIVFSILKHIQHLSLSQGCIQKEEFTLKIRTLPTLFYHLLMLLKDFQKLAVYKIVLR